MHYGEIVSIRVFAHPLVYKFRLRNCWTNFSETWYGSL